MPCPPREPNLHPIEQLLALGFELSVADKALVTQINEFADLFRNVNRGSSSNGTRTRRYDTLDVVSNYADSKRTGRQ